jgi:hypothetical protein
MGERKGFWSERPRRGQQDARLLALERVHALRALSFGELRRRAGREAEIEAVSGLSGERFRRRTAIVPITRDGAEELRISVRVTTPSWFGRLNPLAEILLIATPDGEMTSEYTMASEGNDPRRYRFFGES